MHFDKNISFVDQDLRPDQVLRFWYRMEKDDPRREACDADMKTLTIEEWRLKWAPNLSYQWMGNVKNTSLKEQIVNQLTVVSRQIVRDFALTDAQFEGRLGKEKLSTMMRVKHGGGERLNRNLEEAAMIDKYVRLILKKPYLSFSIGAYQTYKSSKLEWQVSQTIEGDAPTTHEIFLSLAQAKTRLYEMLTDMKERELI